MCVIASTDTCQGACMPASDGICRTNDDCSAQQYCAAATMMGSGLWGSGVCETVVPPGTMEGAPCGTPVQCAPGLSCSGGPAPARCGTGPAAAVGDVCDVLVGYGPFCAPGLACVPSDDGNTKTCMPLAKLGDPCTALLQCGAQYLLSDIVCDQAGTHTCVRRPSTGPCRIVNSEDTCDPVTSYCDSGSGTCKPRLSNGAACVFPASGDNPCRLWSSCSISVCEPLLGACTPK
jgi:hypothetical protein